MKLENYLREDIDESIGVRREALHHLMEVEKHLWTDDIEEAIQRTVDMHLALIQLNKMQSRKRLDDLCNALNNRVKIQIINFRHKKTD